MARNERIISCPICGDGLCKLRCTEQDKEGYILPLFNLSIECNSCKIMVNVGTLYDKNNEDE